MKRKIVTTSRIPNHVHLHGGGIPIQSRHQLENTLTAKESKSRSKGEKIAKWVYEEGRFETPERYCTLASALLRKEVNPSKDP